jgi:hypothetical protein
MECNASLRLENLCRFPCHEKPPSLESGETRKQSLRDGLGRCLLLLEVGGEGFSALQTHAENLQPNQLRNRGMGEFIHQLLIDLPGILHRDAGPLGEIGEGVSLLLAELPNGRSNPLALFS